MAVTWYTQSGTPADATGADGDMSFDYTNRIQWGPRGQKTAGSWTGTAVNAVGPTGPGVLSGTGAPASSLGQTGNMYVDATQGNTYTKGASSWSLVGTLPPGPTGAQGFTTLQTQSAASGQSLYLTGVTLSSTATVMQIAGTAISATANFPFATALIGAFIENTAANSFTLSLVNTSANTTIYSTTVSAGSTTAATSIGPFSATAYPIASSQNLQWQVTGSGSSGTIVITPQYLFPSASAAYGVMTMPFCGRSSTATTWSASYNNLYVSGNTISYIFKAPAKATLYYITAYNQTSSSLTFSVQNYTGNAMLWSGSVAANTTQTFGPLTSYAMTSGSQYYFSATGSGTGAAFMDVNLLNSPAT